MTYSVIQKSQFDTLGERIFNSLFDKCALNLEKIPRKKGGKTSDFYIKKENKIVAVCEVKDMEDPDHHYLSLNTTSKDIERSYRSRIMGKIRDAEKQLEIYSFPKIVCFVSFDMADFYDLKKYLEECLQLFKSLPKLDLYIWLNVHEEIRGSEEVRIQQLRLKSSSIIGNSLLNNTLSVLKSLDLPLVIKL